MLRRSAAADGPSRYASCRRTLVFLYRKSPVLSAAGLARSPRARPIVFGRSTSRRYQRTKVTPAQHVEWLRRLSFDVL